MNYDFCSCEIPSTLIAYWDQNKGKWHSSKIHQFYMKITTFCGTQSASSGQKMLHFYFYFFHFLFFHLKKRTVFGEMSWFYKKTDGFLTSVVFLYFGLNYFNSSLTLHHNCSWLQFLLMFIPSKNMCISTDTDTVFYRKPWWNICDMAHEAPDRSCICSVWPNGVIISIVKFESRHQQDVWRYPTECTVHTPCHDDWTASKYTIW